MTIDPNDKQKSLDKLVAYAMDIMSTMTNEEKDAYLERLRLKAEELTHNKQEK